MLHPGDRLTESLRLTVHTPGWLRIEGVAWTVGEPGSGSNGRLAFDVKGRHRKKPKGTRWAAACSACSAHARS